MRRVGADGAADRSFGDGGEAPLPLLAGSATLPAAAALEDDGRVVVAGVAVGGAGWLLARFTP